MATLPSKCLACAKTNGEGPQEIEGDPFWIDTPFYAGPLCDANCAATFRQYPASEQIRRVLAPNLTQSTQLGVIDPHRQIEAFQQRYEPQPSDTEPHYAMSWSRLFVFPLLKYSSSRPIPDGVAVEPWACRRMQLTEIER